MKKIVILLLLLFSFLPAEAQGPVIWLPLLWKSECKGEMSDWKIIVREATTNNTVNPSAETTGNFAAVGGGAMARSSTYNRYGLYSYRITTAADDQGGTLTLATLALAIHYVSLQVRGTLPASWDWSLNNVNYHVPALLEQIDANWTRYGCQFPAAEANGSTTLYIRQNGAGAGDFYVEAVQVEQKTYWTSFADGDQDGCSWAGAAHASYSVRSAASNAGGRVRDLEDDYAFDIGGMAGLGHVPLTVSLDEYALLPGGEVNTAKVHPRPFMLTGVVRGSSYADLNSKVSTLVSVLLPSVGNPTRLQYWGSTTHKEIAAYYESGLEGDVTAEGPCYWQKLALRFLADDPYLYSEGGTGEGGGGMAALLDTGDSATFRIVAARLKDTGQWDPLGPPAAPGTAVYTYIYAIAEDGTYYYFGGNFTNFDNNANADYIVRYNKQTGAWSPLGTGMDDLVYALVIGSDGTLYAGGAFHNAGGGAAWHIAQWNGAAWSPVGAGLDDEVYGFTVGHDGLIYTTGRFSDLQGGGLADANSVAAWNPITSTWTALATGVDNIATCATTSLDGTIYIGGYFHNAGVVPVAHIAQWDGATWTALSSGLNDLCYALAMGQDGVLYAGGVFTTAGGVTVNYVARWNGTAWTALGVGTNGAVWALSVGPDNTLYVGGIFSVAGGISLANYIAKWSGASWAHLDIDFPGAPTIRAAWASKHCDPVIEENYDVVVGFGTTGTGYYAGLVTAQNAGTVTAYPRIYVKRTGGTATILEEIRNESTGMELLFNYGLLDGESLTIDLDPARQSVISSFFGSRPDAILPNSDMGGFTVEPGANAVTAFVAVSGGPTVTAWMEWPEKYNGL